MVCTKAGISRRTGERVVDTSRRALLEPLDASLRAARHRPRRPVAGRTPGATTAPLEETLVGARRRGGAAAGRATSGVSNYSGWQTRPGRDLAAAAPGRVPLVATQVEYSLLSAGRGRGAAGAAAALGLGPAALVAAGPRGADRQVPPRHPGRLPGRLAALRGVRRALPRRPSSRASSTPWRPRPKGWTARRPRWRWPGCATSRAWSAPIVGARTAAQLRGSLAVRGARAAGRDPVRRWTRSRPRARLAGAAVSSRRGAVGLHAGRRALGPGVVARRRRRSSLVVQAQVDPVVVLVVRTLESSSARRRRPRRRPRPP